MSWVRFGDQLPWHSKVIAAVGNGTSGNPEAKTNPDQIPRLCIYIRQIDWRRVARKNTAALVLILIYLSSPKGNGMERLESLSQGRFGVCRKRFILVSSLACGTGLGIGKGKTGSAIFWRALVRRKWLAENIYQSLPNAQQPKQAKYVTRAAADHEAATTAEREVVAPKLRAIRE